MIGAQTSDRYRVNSNWTLGSSIGIVEGIRGDSYRMRQQTELWQALQAPPDPEPSARRRRVRQEATTT